MFRISKRDKTQYQIQHVNKYIQISKSPSVADLLKLSFRAIYTYAHSYMHKCPSPACVGCKHTHPLWGWQVCLHICWGSVLQQTFQKSMMLRRQGLSLHGHFKQVSLLLLSYSGQLWISQSHLPMLVRSHSYGINYCFPSHVPRMEIMMMMISS